MNTYRVSGEITIALTVNIAAKDPEDAEVEFLNLVMAHVDLSDEGLLETEGLDSFEVQTATAFEIEEVAS